MALEPGARRRSTSPNSGRASPISQNWVAQPGIEESLTKDKYFRRYASGVDRSLSLFDTALQEWADYISFLGRLLKSLQARPSNVAVVPSKSTVAKRLAQCLNPNLPSGVHQKALEVYSYIFSMIGKGALSRDLPTYLPGLSPTLSFASLTVRSPFLTLLENHLLPLESTSLRPALKAIILTLLPGLEEETSEDFERTLKLMDGFKLALRPHVTDISELKHSRGDEYFWQCFFLASITSNSRRPGALAYLVRNLPKLGNPIRKGSIDADVNGTQQPYGEANADQASSVVIYPEPGLLIRCFTAGLSDDQILIQRGFLDLLVTHLPLNSRVLQNFVKREDLELLLVAASGVVARKDMSLNRRLWSWLLGPEPSSGTESPTSPSEDPMNSATWSRTGYFEQYGLKSLTQAILKMVNEEYVSPLERAKPFRICLSLMDRWEIGGLVVPEIFLPIISSVEKYQKQATTKLDFNDVLRSASTFFDGVESSLIWGEITGLIRAAFNTKDHAEAEEKLSLVKFIISHFNVREEEMLMIHAPITALALLIMLEDLISQDQDSLVLKTGSREYITTPVMSISLDLLDLIPARAFFLNETGGPVKDPNDSQLRSQLGLTNDEVLENIRNFYGQDQGSMNAFYSTISGGDVGYLLVSKASKIASQSFSILASSSDVVLKTRLLVMLLNKTPKTDNGHIKSILISIQMGLSKPNELPFSIFTSILVLITALHTNCYISKEDMSILVEPMVRLAWNYLSFSQPKYHVETVRSLWQLQTCLSLSNHEIESAICNLIIGYDESSISLGRDAAPGRTFAILWTHTLQENAANNDRRGSKVSNGDHRAYLVESSLGSYEVMLSRPLFLLLDALLDERTQLFVSVRAWLQSLTGIDSFFKLFVTKFATFGFLQKKSLDTHSISGNVTPREYSEDDDLEQCLYYMQRLSTVLKWSPNSTWEALAHNMISTATLQMSSQIATSRNEEISLQEYFVHMCLQTISGIYGPRTRNCKNNISQLHRTALSVLQQILLNPYAIHLPDLQLQEFLVDRLERSLVESDPFIQVSILDVIYAALKLNVAAISSRPTSSVEDRKPSTQDNLSASKPLLSINKGEQDPLKYPPPVSLIKCLQAGFAAPSSRSALDSWVSFLAECLPFYSEIIFQVLMPLVETFCAQIESSFHGLQATFKNTSTPVDDASAPESTLISLMNGLEQVLARGHERLIKDESKTPTLRSPDQPQGFFGNMVSGVFSSETTHTRSLTANNRLTVLLSFQDAVRICFKIWSWGGRGLETNAQDTESTASFNYTSLRMRNRARRLLEHLFAAEALECLETVIDIWQKESRLSNNIKHTAVFDLLHVLDGSKPKHTIPAIFDAMCSRTIPNTLQVLRKSTLTSTLLDTDLALFLVEYAKSLEDDAMDEIWVDCMGFLREILSNPFPHRQTLPSLLEFAAILGEKVDNTNFGEQKRMRRELGDLFLRLLTATFTTKPLSFSDSNNHGKQEKLPDVDENISSRLLNRSEDIVGVLALITPNLPQILVETDRVVSAASIISTSVIGPTFRSKSYPENVTKNLLVLLYQISRLPNTQKIWKKDLGDAFNDSRFFSNPPTLLESDWLPLLSQWVISDKDRMPELLSRISPPTTAGIVFGVGATSARLEADRRTQLNLRRIATLILATADDVFVTDLAALGDKLVEVLSATITSSPSSATRSEVYMAMRALILKTSPVHLALLWPTVNAELYAAISSIVAPDHSQYSETFNNFSILQACKLLDTLLYVAPDDFQLHEWLFINDTIDAVYRPGKYRPVGIVDVLSDELGSSSVASAAYMEPVTAASSLIDKAIRRPLLGPGCIESQDVNLERKDELIGKVLKPFFSQLSIFTFERTYRMGVPDWKACRQDLLKDLFDERGILKAY